MDEQRYLGWAPINLSLLVYMGVLDYLVSFLCLLVEFHFVIILVCEMFRILIRIIMSLNIL